MDGKRKMLSSILFKVFLKNKWKHRKLKFNRLLHDIRRNSFIKQKKKRHVFISLTYLLA